MPQFIVQGGFFMVLLLACSVVSLATILLRAWALRREKVIPAWLWERVEALKPGGETRESVAGLESALEDIYQGARVRDSALSRITQLAISHLEWPRLENMEAVQTRARAEVHKLETGLSILEVIVGIAPLLGLLGAVSGLVTVFGTLGASEVVTDPRGIAMGISEALNTTIAGLAIAIPSLIAHSYFSKKVETLAVEMEAIIGELLTKCYSRHAVVTEVKT